MNANRPLSPSTLEKYARILERTAAFSPAQLNALPNTQKRLLRAAARWREATGGTAAASVLAQTVPVYEIQKALEIPDEGATLAYEAAADKLTAVDRALALIPLRLGLRAAEVCSLTRASVEAAIRTSALKAVVKGGRERFIPADKVTDLLQTLLDTPKAHPLKLFYTPKEIAANAKAKWACVGEIISTGKENAQYRSLWRIVRRVGKRAGWLKSRPHLLRHAFGTRMNRDGAPLSTIQAALGHRSIQTTTRYVHPSGADVAKYMR